MNYYGLSEKGPVREKNEDCFDCSIINGCLCMLIADGLGGEVCGEVASKIAVETVMKLFENNPDAIKDGEHMSEFLASVFNKANKEILRYENDHPECRGMCTTLTVAVQNDTKLYISHIGDTRAYLCHRREIQKLTIDHNKAAQLVKEGKITETEAKVHPGRNVLLKVLGENVYLKPDFFSYNLSYGDIVMLCSDGLYSFIGKEDFIAALNLRRDMKLVCESLIDASLKGGSSDNTTIVAGQCMPSGHITGV
ncbi:MAG: serine/threonine-protein phosphatase [Clostridiales bacterium]|nr:serine/threonine-protein phosphatase [Clostridiales bacterium]